MHRHLSMEEAKTIYRAAIDSDASDGEGLSWWQEVRDEVAQVLDARTLAAAADVISWWHNDWRRVSDHPRAAAKRLREVAKTLAAQDRIQGNRERQRAA